MESGLNLELLPVYCGSSFRYFEPGEKHVTRVFTQDVLLLVFEGVLRFSENGRPIEVGKGEYYIQRSGLLQEGTVKSDCPQYYYIHFRGVFSPLGKTLPLRGEIQTGELFALFRRLDLLQAAGASALEENAVFYQILTALLRPFRSTGQNRAFQKAAALFAHDLRHPFSLDELSQLCGYSKNQLINIFKAETGKTPYSYVMGLRREAARQLLLNSEMPAAQVAAECGYGSYVNFYKDFVRSEGCPPAEWRRSRQESALPLSDGRKE